MFFASFVTYFKGGFDAPRGHAAAQFLVPRIRESLAMRLAGYAAKTHFLVAPAVVQMTAAEAGGFPRAAHARRFALDPLRRLSKSLARAALRAAYAGSPLTPTGYAILALTVAAVALVAMLSTSSLGDELAGALRLSWWFC
ncbi:MAG TPA: hypothetical protein VF534_05490 [Paraburkholderia sp.]